MAALPLDVCLLFEALLTTTPDNYACASTDFNRLQPTSTDFNRLQACASTDFNRLTMPWYVRFTVAQQRSESENARKARTLGKLGWRPSERTDAGQMPCPKARKARLTQHFPFLINTNISRGRIQHLRSSISRETNLSLSTGRKAAPQGCTRTTNHVHTWPGHSHTVTGPSE